MPTASDPPATIVAALHRRRTDDGSRTALVVDRGNGYESLTWSQIVYDVEAALHTFGHLDLEPEQHVALLGGNCYEWLVADLALQLLGAVSVPLHLSLTPAQIAAQVQHADVRWALVADRSQLARLAPELGLRGIIVWRKSSSEAIPQTSTPVYFWPDLLTGHFAFGGLLSALARQSEPDELATIIYTSGTTGEPKGVMLSHGNLAFNAWATWTTFGNPPSERRFSLLPWSHAFARTCDLYAWIVSGTQLIVGRSRESALADMQATQPTYLNGVPYFFQKVQRAIEAAGGGETPDAAKNLLGGHLRACCSGGAPLPDGTFNFYQRQQLPVLEGYGMTEAGPVISTCTETAFRRGSVGQPLQGVEVRIAGDGEVLTRGPHVMLGYYNDPAGTAEAIRDGWLHTGDLGQLDADGFLHLTGRKKELIVLSTGRKVSPALLESLLTQDPLIEQAVIVGDGQKELAALIVPNETPADDSARSALREQVLHVVRERLRERPAHEQVRRIALLQRPLSQKAGELSAKQSLCRAVIASRHARTIATLWEQQP